MAFEFRLPDIGEGLTEAEVVAWFVEPGGEVELDQPLVQIEADKAVTDIPAPREDVEAASKTSEGPEERIRLSKLRRTVAENMARSWREIPHVTTFGEADASALLAARRDLGERRGRPVPWEALFVQAVLPALQDHAEFSASLEGHEL